MQLEWIELDCILFDKTLKELGVDGKDIETTVKMNFRVSQITGVRQLLDDDGEVIEDETLIYCVNDSYVVKHSYNELIDWLC
jgi:hypothetical protein